MKDLGVIKMKFATKRFIPSSFENPYFRANLDFFRQIRKDRDLWVSSDLKVVAAILCIDFESREQIIFYKNLKMKQVRFFEYIPGCLDTLADEKLKETLKKVLTNVSNTQIVQVTNSSGVCISSEEQMEAFYISGTKYKPSIEIYSVDTITELYNELVKIDDNFDMEGLLDKIKSIILLNDLMR
jgi:hypothetical protein